MIIKLATLIVKQDLPKAVSNALMDNEQATTYIPRPANEQIGRKKNPVRIIQQ